MQELINVKNKKFLKILSKLGFRLLGNIDKDFEFPVCVDLLLKTAYRLTSVACLACFAMAKKRTLTEDEFLAKYQLGWKGQFGNSCHEKKEVKLIN